MFHLTLTRRVFAASRAVAICAAVFTAASAIAAAATPVVAVFSKTMNGYSRTQLPDNTYKPELYAFADGGRLPGSDTDPSIDDLKFVQVAGVVAAELKRENYYQTADPTRANLLIFVSFGTTAGYDDTQGRNAMTGLSAGFNSMKFAPTQLGASGIVNTQQISDGLSGFWGLDSSFDQIAFANQIRDENNEFNAGILGYDKAWHETNVMRPYLQTARDILNDIEQSHYFVVLKAYDFQELRQHRRKKLLWETRYSILRYGNRFDEQLVDMTRYAAQFCGQNIDHLIRRHIPEGHVKIGPLKVVPTSAK